MEDPCFEIRDEKIDAEKIMAEIRENLQRRQAAGEHPMDPEFLVPSPSYGGITGTSENDDGSGDIPSLNSTWDIYDNSYVIESRRPLLGKLIVKGRTLVHGEVCRYVDPMIIRQAEFNAGTVRVITHLLSRCSRLEQIVSCQGEEIKELTCMISRLKEDPGTCDRHNVGNDERK